MYKWLSSLVLCEIGFAFCSLGASFVRTNFGTPYLFGAANIVVGLGIVGALLFVYLSFYLLKNRDTLFFSVAELEFNAIAMENGLDWNGPDATW
ncbi:MAG: hypothetical protein ACW99U_13755 [Candidatus Thorarchaeota archaeon]|jgi:hypothetical protein